jgi:RNA polymerase primary sigma factor
MLVRASRPARGLDEPVDQDGRSPADTVGDPASEDAFEHVRLRLAARALPDALSTLTGRELSIIRGRYGLGGRQRSLAELADEWQISRERVRQIERAAMGKLRQSCDAPCAQVS